MSNAVMWQAYGGSAADCYQRYLVPAIFRPWAADLVARAALQPGERVLDVACGTGAVAGLITERVGASGRVVGLDINGEMLRAARALPTQVPIEWVEGSAMELPFEDNSFDVVLCQQGLQFFPDWPRALAEMRRVLVPNGRLLLSVWRSIAHNPAFGALSASLARHLGPQAGVLPPFALGDAEEVPRLVTAAGFGAVTDEVVPLTLSFPSPSEFVQRYVAATPLSATFAAMDEATRDAIVADVRRALVRYVDATGLACPMATRIVTARR